MVKRADKAQWQIIRDKLITKLSDGQLADTKNETVTIQQISIIEQGFKAQLLSRHLDYLARYLRLEKKSYYTIGSAGHEGNAAFALCAAKDDSFLLHYRSAALLLARQQQLSPNNYVADFVRGLMAKTTCPVAGGVHKVLGDSNLGVWPQTSIIASHLPKSLGKAFAISVAASIEKPKNKSQNKLQPIVFCSFGDASMNHASAQAAFNTSRWLQCQAYPLRLIWICEDNGLGISVPSPKGWVERFGQSMPHYISARGWLLNEVIDKAQQAIDYTRKHGKPVFFHLKTMRLLGHAGSDVEEVYLSTDELEQQEYYDPIWHTASWLVQNGGFSTKEIWQAYQNAESEVNKAYEIVAKEPDLVSTYDAMRHINSGSDINAIFNNLKSNDLSEKKLEKKSEEKLTLAKTINLGLNDILSKDSKSVLLGEDVGKKGGVYRVTQGLQQKWGKRRVWDTLLDEQSILGMAMGLASEGFFPIVEIQYLAYLYNAYDQIRGELATTSFLSKGNISLPMLIRLPSFAYQGGVGGHFHAENCFAALREIPGLSIVCLSQPNTARNLINQAFAFSKESKTPVLIFEPIALYHQKNIYTDIYTENNNQLMMSKIGCGQDAAIVSFGNGVKVALQAMQELKELGINITVYDWHWLKPLPEKNWNEIYNNFNYTFLVDESRKTGSISEQVSAWWLARVQNDANKKSRLECITGEDGFITQGQASDAMVPQSKNLVKHISTIMQK